MSVQTEIRPFSGADYGEISIGKLTLTDLGQVGLIGDGLSADGVGIDIISADIRPTVDALTLPPVEHIPGIPRRNYLGSIAEQILGAEHPDRPGEFYITSTWGTEADEQNAKKLANLGLL